MISSGQLRVAAPALRVSSAPRLGHQRLSLCADFHIKCCKRLRCDLEATGTNPQLSERYRPQNVLCDAQ